MSLQKSDHPATTPTTPHKATPSPKPHVEAEADLDPFAAPSEYYGKSHGPRRVAKSRTYSAHDAFDPIALDFGKGRRGSHDVQSLSDQKFLIKVKETLKDVLAREDTDGNTQITIDDKGPKSVRLATEASSGLRYVDVRGTYAIANLLQELTLAEQYGRKTVVLDLVRLNQNPVIRLSQRIRDVFWPKLERSIDGSNIFQVARDPKDWTSDPRPRIYVPRGVPEQYEYYQRIAAEHPDQRLDVQWLAEDPGNEEYVRDLNEAPGLLAIEMERIADTKDGKPDYRGLPFVVPGGRFNELYGWDSYMETLGLLIHDKVDLCANMVKHFCFCIRHYGKILNANRTYYLCRSQPPFLTDMALRVYDRIQHEPGSLEFLRRAMLAAIKDYYNTWMSAPRLDETTGLSRYVPGGIGVPPETEATHFVHILTPYAKKHNMTFAEFVKAYNYSHVFEPELDQYFLHDRSVRESGHDTSYRLEKVSAHLATVDLNSLLYKYETDIARTIRTNFGDKFEIPPEWRVKGQPAIETSSIWDRRARKRRAVMEKLMWSEDKGMFFDYNTVKHEQTGYESATTFWALWAGVATPQQASTMVAKALPRFEVHGGLVSGTEESRGPVGLQRPNRQWDYPFGWAPQQILAWSGLQRYGFHEEAQRLAYRWVYMCTKAFVDFNGVVVEKYDVTRQIDPHKVTAEYGNQGSDFKGVALEGFGWVNASYIIGLQIVTAHMKRALGAVTTWDTFQKMTTAAQEKEAWKFELQQQAHQQNGDIVLPLPGDARNVHHDVLPHSREDLAAHLAVHGNEKVLGHRGPDVLVSHS